MNKETYTKIRDEGRARRKERREKVEAAIKKAGSPITILQQVDSGEFHSDTVPTHNRESRRRQLGIRRQPARGHKAAYRDRAAEHREVVAQHRELHDIKVRLTNFIHRTARQVRDLG